MKNQLQEIKNWFIEAVADPSPTNKVVQLGCHVEEVAEMMEALSLESSALTLHQLGNCLKQGMIPVSSLAINRQELLDALCDQIVTAVGVAHMFDLNILDGLTEVNRSNWSKFVDGKPIFNEHGKISKGPDYSKPDLTGLF